MIHDAVEGGVNTYAGKLTYEAVAFSRGHEYTRLDQLLSLDSVLPQEARQTTRQLLRLDRLVKKSVDLIIGRSRGRLVLQSRQQNNRNPGQLRIAAHEASQLLTTQMRHYGVCDHGVNW